MIEKWCFAGSAKVVFCRISKSGVLQASLENEYEHISGRLHTEITNLYQSSVFHCVSIFIMSKTNVSKPLLFIGRVDGWFNERERSKWREVAKSGGIFDVAL